MGNAGRESSGSAWLGPAAVVGLGALTWLLAPPPWREALFAARWPWWAAGAGIGALLLAMGALVRRPLGVSSGYVDACAAPTDPDCRRSWRLPFLAGIVAGGLLAGLAAGAGPSWAAGPLDALLGEGTNPAKLAWFAGGGVLVGLGARLAGGCTSGHGILGVSRLSAPSLLATALFMAAGFAATHLLLGGG